MKKFFLFFDNFNDFTSFLSRTNKAKKMTINPDPLTEKWIKCENSSPEEYQKNLEEFLIEVENSKPDKTILYYFPANHKDRNGKSNNYDLITRVKVTDTAPASPQDVVAIHDNPGSLFIGDNSCI